jgi:hypothetical protein
MLAGRLYHPTPRLAVFLLFLCLFDTILTDIGLRTGFTYEMNPVTNYLYYLNPDHHLVYYFLKLSLPILLIWYTMKRPERKKLIVITLSIVTMFYIVAALLHVKWIALYYWIYLSLT